MRIGSGYRTLNSRPLLPSSSCPQKVRLFILCCTEGIRGRTPIPIQGHKTGQSPTPLETEGERGPLGDCPVPESPAWRGVRQAGVGPMKLSHPGLG